MDGIANTLRDISQESKLNPAEKASLKAIAKEFDHVAGENDKLRKYITDCVFVLTSEIISMEYARVGGTDKDTKAMEILRIIRLKGEQVLKAPAAHERD